MGTPLVRVGHRGIWWGCIPIVNFELTPFILKILKMVTVLKFQNDKNWPNFHEKEKINNNYFYHPHCKNAFVPP